MRKRKLNQIAEGSLLLAATAFVVYAYNQPHEVVTCTLKHNEGFYKLFDKANAFYMAMATMLLAMEWSRKNYILGIIGYMVGFATLWNAKDYLFHAETNKSILEFVFGFLLLLTTIYLILRRKNNGTPKHS